MMKFFRKFNDLGIKGSDARWYDKNSRNHRLDEMRGYAAEVAKHVGKNGVVLEVAPGPGYLSIALAKMGNYKITGMDISQDFVGIARKNAKDADVNVDFVQGNVAEMPFPADTFDFIICTAAFKNFKEPLKALNEMYRVLKPGGGGLIVDMNRAVSNKKLDESVKAMKLKGLQALFMKLTFKYFLKKGAYTKDEIISLASKTAFAACNVAEEGIGLNIYLQK